MSAITSITKKSTRVANKSKAKKTLEKVDKGDPKKSNKGVNLTKRKAAELKSGKNQVKEATARMNNYKECLHLERQKLMAEAGLDANFNVSTFAYEVLLTFANFRYVTKQQNSSASFSTIQTKRAKRS